MPYVIVKRGGEFCVYKEGDGGRPDGETLGCHASTREAEEQVRALYVNEMGTHFGDVMAVTELRGGYPNVPTFSDVDYEALVFGDPDPVFLTIPIGKAGVTSTNRRHYDAEFLQELERQTISRKPIGIMGHLTPEERGTAFPPEAIHWVGALREGDTLWGKGYIPPGPVRERIRRYKAQGRSLATSIDAIAEGVYEQGLRAIRMKPESLRLNQIDIAPADRAGIPELAHIPILTTEMRDGAEEQENDVDRSEVIKGLTVEDIPSLPAAVRDAILAGARDPKVDPKEVEQIAEVSRLLGIEESADPVAAVSEMVRRQEDQRREEIKRRIQELASDDKQGVKVESVRGIVVELVTARNPNTVQEVEQAYKEVVGSESVRRILQSRIIETMGPNISAPVPGRGEQRKYFDIPKEE